MDHRFDEKYDIRLATIDDTDAIMEFIAKYWKPHHLMSLNKKYFEYEFRDGNDIHFIIAVFKETGLIEGVLGYLYSSHTPGKMDAWGSILKANMGRGNMLLLGTEIMKRFQTMTHYRHRCGVGANTKTNLPIADKVLHYHNVKLHQFYLLNKNIREYKIAVIDAATDSSGNISANFVTEAAKFSTLAELRQHFDVEQVDAVPYKDNWYMGHRYYDHPWYEYEVYGLNRPGEKTGAIMVTRTVPAEGSCVIRIVDYIGDHRLFAGLGQFFKDFLAETGAEYVDFYEFGFDKASLLGAGFVEHTDEAVILPNYFEPFLRENVDIWGFWTAPGTTLFKGDGDQDRPNEDRGDWTRFGEWK